MHNLRIRNWREDAKNLKPVLGLSNSLDFRWILLKLEPDERGNSPPPCYSRSKTLRSSPFAFSRVRLRKAERFLPARLM